jgi:hypothetical protein
MKKAWDMEDTMVRKAPLKTFISQKGQVTKFPQHTWIRKDRLHEDAQRELRRKKL